MTGDADSADGDDGAALLATLSTASLWGVSADAEEGDDDDDDGEATGGGTLGMDTGLAWARAPLYWEKGQESTTALRLVLSPATSWAAWAALCWPVRIFITRAN